ncbi:DUF2500 domain-containing protein [Sporosarcina sp. FSL W7-1349]|uniref:DUF2500 domain-containing protein n=1 Tax=Sporosarcina sp. FSL W7-1349 TaxID=2921561 RepID=UPI0030F5DC17
MDFVSFHQAMFTYFPLFIAIFFAVFIIKFIFRGVRFIQQWRLTKNSPELAVPAWVVGKQVKERSRKDSARPYATMYYVTFKVESSDEMELRVPQADYSRLEKDMLGMLRFKGARYLGFERHS